MSSPVKIEKTLSVQGLPILLRKKRQKNLYLYVRPEGCLVTAPTRMPEKTIVAFVESRIPWIQERQAALSASPLRRAPTGNQALVWGTLLEVRYSPAVKAASLEEGVLTLPAAGEEPPEKREERLSQWYRGELRRAAEPLLVRWSSALGLEVPWWSVRRMRTRWGTCSPQKKRVWLNLQLVHYPPECLEYVVVHELCHLLEPSHNRIFWGHVADLLPDWRERRGLLSEFSVPDLP